jgi:hypothetical protein
VEPEVRRSVLCCRVWEESLLSRREDFAINLVIKTFYKSYALSTIFKDNAVLLFNAKESHTTLVPNVFIDLLKQHYRNYLFGSELVGSISVVSDYGPDDRAIEIRSPSKAKEFSCSLCVQTGSEAHLASCTMGTVSPPG